MDKNQEGKDYKKYIIGQDLLLSHKAISLYSPFNPNVKPVQKNARSLIKDPVEPTLNLDADDSVNENKMACIFEELECFNLSEPENLEDKMKIKKKQVIPVETNKQVKIVIAEDAKVLREGAAYFNYLADQILGPEPIFDKKQMHAPIMGVLMKRVEITFNTRCAFDLKFVAESIRNVEVIGMDERSKVLNLSIPRCKTKALLHATGRVFCSVHSSADMARRVARRLLHALSQLQYKVSFSRFRVLEMHAIGYMPWNVDIKRFAKTYSQWVRYRRTPTPMAQAIMSRPASKANIFHIGAVNITVMSAADLNAALQRIHSYLKPFCRIRSAADNQIMREVMRYGNLSGGFDFYLPDDL